MTEITGANANKNLMVRDMDDAHFKENGETVELVSPFVTENYAQNAANTSAEVVAGAGKAVDFGSTEWLTTNGAVEPASTGRRNPNGTMGFGSSRNVLTTAGVIPVDKHGAAYILLSAGYTLPSPVYQGQVIMLYQNGVPNAPTVYEHTISGLIGVSRHTDNSIRRLSTVFKLRMKDGEVITLLGSGNGSWFVQSHHLNPSSDGLAVSG